MSLRRPERDKRLLDRDVREERPEYTDDDGEEDRGVEELSELSTVYEYEAMDMAVLGRVEPGTGAERAGLVAEKEKGSADLC